MPFFNFRLHFFSLLVALLALCRVPLLANMANPVQAGDVIGEPSGMLDSIAVLREQLRIDMTPIGAGEDYGWVSAEYTVMNNGAERTLSLVFLAGAMQVRYPTSGNAHAPDTTFTMEVTLDGQPVAITVAFAPTDSLPAEWRVPGSTPSLNGSDSVRYVARNEGVIRFTLRIPSGQHIVRVRYRAEPTSNSSGGRATKLWQFAYVLAPARQWDGFGTLEATVTVPSGWEATATPSMARKEDSLTGTWQGIPADAIALSFAMPSPTYLPYLENGLPILASLLGIFFCWVVGSRVGRWLVRTKKTPSWSVPFALLAGGAWALLVLGGMLLASSIVQNELGNQLARGYGYGSAIALILLYMPGAFLAGTLLTVVAAYRAAKRSG